MAINYPSIRRFVIGTREMVTDGIEFLLVKTIAEKLDMKAVFRVMDDATAFSVVTEDEETGFYSDLIKRKVDVMIGGLYDNEVSRKLLSTTIPYVWQTTAVYTEERLLMRIFRTATRWPGAWLAAVSPLTGWMFLPFLISCCGFMQWSAWWFAQFYFISASKSRTIGRRILPGHWWRCFASQSAFTDTTTLGGPLSASTSGFCYCMGCTSPPHITASCWACLQLRDTSTRQVTCRDAVKVALWQCQLCFSLFVPCELRHWMKLLLSSHKVTVLVTAAAYLWKAKSRKAKVFRTLDEPENNPSENNFHNLLP